ncbi:hypothetical protein DY000_02048094 [Brassica cretica]|uniref:Uncharacterized protein n=1 Tax=Brassica cretica TaxID=69181 RepID=A0ABQ7F4H1_BRACR|nr:hypothetical protein DY000_02048094 [Brassica cretica]
MIMNMIGISKTDAFSKHFGWPEKQDISGKMHLNTLMRECCRLGSWVDEMDGRRIDLIGKDEDRMERWKRAVGALLQEAPNKRYAVLTEHISWFFYGQFHLLWAVRVISLLTPSPKAWSLSVDCVCIILLGLVIRHQPPPLIVGNCGTRFSSCSPIVDKQKILCYNQKGTPRSYPWISSLWLGCLASSSLI